MVWVYSNKRNLRSSICMLGLCLLVATGFPEDVAGQSTTVCNSSYTNEPRLSREIVLRFFETTEALRQTAADLGLRPHVSSLNPAGQPTPSNIVRSLNQKEPGINLLQQQLRQGGFCKPIDFSFAQRVIYQAQNFIDIGGDRKILQRQLDASCKTACSSFLLTLGVPPMKGCHTKCIKSDRNFFRVPPRENVEVLRSLQSEIPTSYILSWKSLRATANP